ncbi:MAG: cytochrome c [Candidatus Tumulicola sp.]
MRFFKFFTLGLVAAVAFAACAKNNSSTNETTAQTTAAAAQGTAAPMQAAAGGTAAGAKVYQTNCSSCHQADGKGLAGSFPPLAGNPMVIGDPKNVIHAVKYGLTGKIAVQGHVFNGIMPPWGSQLSNTDIAAAVTYVRSSWGNKATAVTEAAVNAVSK